MSRVIVVIAAIMVVFIFITLNFDYVNRCKRNGFNWSIFNQRYVVCVDEYGRIIPSNFLVQP